jgi:hypothetical protein
VVTLILSGYASRMGTPNCDGLLTSEHGHSYVVLRVFYFDPHPCDPMLLLQPQTILKTFINKSYKNDTHVWNATCFRNDGSIFLSTRHAWSVIGLRWFSQRHSPLQGPHGSMFFQVAESRMMSDAYFVCPSFLCFHFLKLRWCVFLCGQAFWGDVLPTRHGSLDS